MDMLDIDDLPASCFTPCPPSLQLPSALGRNSKAPPSRSTASSCGDSVAVDSSDKDCELSEKVGCLHLITTPLLHALSQLTHVLNIARLSIGKELTHLSQTS